MSDEGHVRSFAETMLVRFDAECDSPVTFRLGTSMFECGFSSRELVESKHGKV